MASSKEYLNYILDSLSELEDISYRRMMGEYIIYYKGKIAAYICDNSLFIKPTATAVKLMPNSRFEPPYTGAKDMLLAANTDDKEFFTLLFTSIFDELDYPKSRRK